MPRVDDAERRLHLKIAYFGPALAGKSMNVQYVYARTAPEARTPMRSVSSESTRMLSFTLVPRTLPRVNDREVVLELACVPGTVLYDLSRHALLEGADAFVFVADSAPERAEANVESLALLRPSLGEGTPLVLQYNKRDLPNALAVDAMDAALNPHAAFARHLAVASTGEGVFPTLRDCAGQLVSSDSVREQ